VRGREDSDGPGGVDQRPSDFDVACEGMHKR
jgi:hypothetical protein